MARVLKSIGIFLAVALIAVVLYLRFADFSGYRSDVEAAVSEATGREFRISGEFAPEVLPAPSFVIGGVTLANADWGSDRPMLSIGEMSVEIGLWSLVSGPIRVREFRLSDVEVLLEENENGDANWILDTGGEPEDAGESGSGAIPAIIEFAQIRNIKVTHRNASDDDRIVSISTLDVMTNEENYLATEGHGKLDELEFRLNGSVGPLDQLDSGIDVDYRLDANLDLLQFNVEGNTGAGGSFAGARQKIVVASDDVAPLIEMLGLSVPLAGPMRIESIIADDGQPGAQIDASIGEIEAHAAAALDADRVDFKISLASLESLGAALNIAGLPATPLLVDGTLISTPDSYELRGISAQVLTAQSKINAIISKYPDLPSQAGIHLSVPDLSEWSSDLPAIPLTSSATVSISNNQVNVDPFEFMFGGSDLSGSLHAQLDETIFVAASVQSKLIDLTPFQKDVENVDEDVPDPAVEDTDTKWVFGEEKLTMDVLGNASVDLDIKIDNIRQGNLNIVDLEMEIDVDNEQLDIRTGFEAPRGGSADAAIALAVNGAGADLTLLLDLQDLRLNVMSGDVADASQIPPIGLHVDVRSSGNSPRALAAGANGRVVLTQGPGKIKNAAVGMVSGDIIAKLFSSLNPMAADEEFSNWECTVFVLDIVEGQSDIGTMLAQGEKVTIVGGGEIDLTTEKLNINFNTKPRTGVGVSADMFVTPFVKLTGQLASPRIGVNKKGAAVVGGAAVMTGGISLLVQGAADRATAEADKCAAAIATIGERAVTEN